MKEVKLTAKEKERLTIVECLEDIPLYNFTGDFDVVISILSAMKKKYPGGYIALEDEYDALQYYVAQDRVESDDEYKKRTDNILAKKQRLVDAKMRKYEKLKKDIEKYFL